jgi:hypothetical protein
MTAPIAVLVSRRPDDVREAVTQALRHFEPALGSDNRETRSARELLATLE